MEKKTLYFKADNQSLVGQNVPARLASDTVSYIEAVFDLGENWSGFDAVKAIWSTDFDSICTVLDSSGACVVPYEVLERVGDVWVNLVGSISEDETLTDRLTTYPIKAITVDANAAVCGSETAPITPSQFDQFAAAVRADADRAEEGATAAAASASSAAASATSASGSASSASHSASGAAQSAQSASESAGAAAQSASSASDSAADAEEAKNAILNMTATATTLPEGSSATVDYNNGVMAFGIPRGDTGEKGDKGDTGETGATPNLSIGTVETLAPDEDATATITGTAENPVLNLGLPKGETGEVSLLELIANTKVDEKSDSVPYQMRTLSGVGSHESLRKIVGGTVAWNQLANPSNEVYTNNGVTFTKENGAVRTSGIATGLAQTTLNWPIFTTNHVYGLWGCPSNGSSETFFLDTGANLGHDIGAGRIAKYTGETASKYLRVYVREGTDVNGLVFKPQLIDLTAMFGTTIADYIYSLEQANAGDGVAFFKALFPEDYYPYDLGTLKSVQTSAHKTYDADGNVLGTYPLDNSITLMGIPKLDSSNNLYYDGDTYEPDGTVTRKYGVVVLNGSEPSWGKSGGALNGFYIKMGSGSWQPYGHMKANAPVIALGYTYTNNVQTYFSNYGYTFTDTTISFNINPDICGSTIEEFKAWLAQNPITVIYELATPTTETATAYTELQSVESGGSEEFVGATIPVGHESTYPRTLADTMPTQDGSYSLSLTVSGGKPSVEWEVSQ